jgi:hypothetical protein
MMGGCPMMGATADGKISTFAAGRIAFLKAELGITEAQKSVWDAYAETIKGKPRRIYEGAGRFRLTSCGALGTAGSLSRLRKGVSDELLLQQDAAGRL